MAATYQFTLQQEKQASYFRIELIVVLLHGITFLVFAFTHYPKGIGMSAFGIAVAVIYLVLYYLHKNKPFRFTALEVPLYFFSGWWLATGVYWMALLVLAFSCFATISRQKVQVFFSAGGILYKSFPKREFEWATVNNVVVKDGMLTIDFKSNKLIQQLIEESGIDETEFNHYCQQQLTASHSPIPNS